MDSALSSNKSEVALLATSLDKLLVSHQLSDEVLVIIDALENVAMTVELLRGTKIGVIVNKCKKKFPDNNELSEKCKNLINEWKKIAEAPKSIPATETPTLETKTLYAKDENETQIEISLKMPHNTSSDRGTEVPASTSSSSARATSSPLDEANTGFNDYYDNLPRSRKQVIPQTSLHPLIFIIIMM